MIRSEMYIVNLRTQFLDPELLSLMLYESSQAIDQVVRATVTRPILSFSD